MNQEQPKKNKRRLREVTIDKEGCAFYSQISRVISPKYTLYILEAYSWDLNPSEPFFTFGSNDYWKMTEKDIQEYIRQLQEDIDYCFENGVVKIRGTNECVVCVVNNHLINPPEEWSEEEERLRLENVRMITPIISEWLDRAFRDEL